MAMEAPVKAGPDTKRYYVIFRVEARFMAEVITHNLEDARKKAESIFTKADFGAATDIDGEPIIIEDEHGNYVWEK